MDKKKSSIVGKERFWAFTEKVEGNLGVQLYETAAVG
jgi:hypothetical protein